MLLVVRTDKLF